MTKNSAGDDDDVHNNDKDHDEINNVRTINTIGMGLDIHNFIMRNTRMPN